MQLTHDEERYVLSDGDPLEVTIRGEPYLLGAGTPLVIKRTRPRPRSRMSGSEVVTGSADLESGGVASGHG